MRVNVNGEPRDLPNAMTIADLIAQLGLSERRIAVELNLDIVPREDYSARQLRDGDAVEVVHFVGGG